MFRHIINNKKGQNTAEYAILISLVVAGIIAMQTYAQRALQARVRDAAIYMAEQTSGIGEGDRQYEPYYLETDYTVRRAENETVVMGQDELGRDMDSSRIRESGFQSQSYDDPSLDTGL